MSEPKYVVESAADETAAATSSSAWNGRERRREDRGFSLAAFSISHPHLIVVAGLMFAILGVLSYVMLPTDLLPAANLPAVQVVSFYSGMPVREVEKNLTERLERYTGEAVGMERQESRSLVGVSVIRNYFGASTDLNTAIAHTTASVMTALRKLPPGTMPPLILPFDPMAATPLALAAVSGDFSESHLFDIARHEVGNAIQAVPGAMAPTIMGGSERQITAYLDPSKLAKYNLSPLSVLDRLTSFNTLIPPGDITLGDYDVQIESNGSVRNVEEMNEFPLRSETGVAIRMKDVGKVEDAKAIQTNVVMVDGKRQVYVPVFRQPGANSIRVVENVKVALASLEKEMQKYKFRVVMDQSSFIRHAIASISEEAWIGGAAAALMVLAFLGSFRATGAVLLSLPLSILPAFLGLKVLGATINAMTLGGLALSIGVLVDNSIVVIENIMKKLASGMPPARASLEGAREVAMPVLASTLVTLIVFLPVIFLTGIVKTLFLALSVAVVCAMAGSYAVAMTVIPLFTAHHLKGRAAREPRGVFAAIEEKIERVIAAYGRLLRKALILRRGFLVVTLCLLGVAASLCTSIGTELFPRADAGNMVLQIRLRSGTKVDSTVELTQRLDGKIREWIEPSDLSMIVANAGVYYGFPAAFTTNSGTQDVFLNIELTETRRHTSQYYAAILRKKIPAAFPGVEVAIQLGGLLTSALNGGLPAPIDIQIQGPKLERSHELAEELASRIRRIPGSVDVRVQQRFDAPKLELDIDRAKAAALGLTVDQALKNVVGALRSSVTFNPAMWVDPKNGVAYEVGVQLRERDVSSVEQLMKIPVIGAGRDRSVPLGRIASVGRSVGPTEINHVNLASVIDIYLDAQDRDIGGLARDISREIEAMHFPRNYRAEIRGEVAEMKNAVGSLTGGFALAALFVYLLLVVQFRSFSLPLIIMTTVPLALVGIGIALAVTKTSFSIQAAIGAIFMVGVAVAHGVLLIEFILHQAKSSKETHIDDAIVTASMARIRPITMTALASILALIPMAIGIGHGSEANIPLGRAVIGGQILSTVLTLFLVPCLFRVLYRPRPPRRLVSAVPMLLLVALPVLFFPKESRAQELSLKGILELAASSDPRLASAQYRELAAEAAIGAARSGYLPSIALEASDSPGYPGSSSDLGVTGLMGSPFKGGAAAGVVAKIPLWDFGRTYWKVEGSERLAREEKQATRLSRRRVYERALHAFIECAKIRSEIEEWQKLADQASEVGKEVKGYVRTGQRQVIESYFADGQVEEALGALEDSKERYLSARRELSLLTGARSEIRCPRLPSEQEILATFAPAEGENPLIAKEEASRSVLEANVQKVKADYNPRIAGVFSAGAMQSSHVVPEQSYALGIGVIIPVFDGFRTTSELREATALAKSKESDIEATRLEVRRMNEKLDGTIASTRARLRHIEQRIDLSHKAFELAKARYTALEGSVMDVREAFRALFRPTSELLQARAELLESVGAKALWNGAEPSP